MSGNCEGIMAHERLQVPVKQQEFAVICSGQIEFSQPGNWVNLESVYERNVAIYLLVLLNVCVASNAQQPAAKHFNGAALTSA